MTDIARAKTLLERIAQGCKQILKEQLVGVYAHGSLAFGCFTWATGDIDFLIVVQRELTQQQKEALITFAMEMEAYAPTKGLEMSVMRLDDCLHFRHPAPYELHYSAAHRAAYQADLAGYCVKMQGVDADLAAHCTVMRAVGYTVQGWEIESVFGAVPREAYIDSIWYDIQNARAEINGNPVYTVLNLCRVLAFLREGKVLSKADGGAWGSAHLPAKYEKVIINALEAYGARRAFDQPDAQLGDFADYMLGCINDAK